MSIYCTPYSAVQETCFESDPLVRALRFQGWQPMTYFRFRVIHHPQDCASRILGGYTNAVTVIAMRNEGTALVPSKPGHKRPADVPSNVTEDVYFSEVLQPSPMFGISYSRSRDSTPIPTQQRHVHGYHGHSSQALKYVKYLWSMRERRWKDGSATIGDDIEDLLQYYMYVS